MAPKLPIRFTLTQAYVLGLMMMAVGLTLSPFLMSLSQFWLVIVWIVDCFCTKSIHNKLSRFWHNKPAVLLVAFYLMHVVGLIYTSDFLYALKDLRVKLPILVLPFILSSMPTLERKRFDQVMFVYVLSVFVATIFSGLAYWRHDYEDIREISHFISHIRFCLNIVFCIAIIFWYIATTKIPEHSRNIEGSKARFPVPAFSTRLPSTAISSTSWPFGLSGKFISSSHFQVMLFWQLSLRFRFSMRFFAGRRVGAGV